MAGEVAMDPQEEFAVLCGAIRKINRREATRPNAIPHVGPLAKNRKERELPQVLQEWREHLGRWIPVNFIRPGYFADPPQFDPLPGEVLSTPAFPAEEFSAKPPAEPIDVVIPLADAKRGIPHADAELRYCLRSIEKHLDGLGRVWIVGRLPEWAIADGESLIHLPVPDICPIKDVSMLHKIGAACAHVATGQPRVAERFVHFCDDVLLLRPVVWAQIGPYHIGDLRSRTNWPTGWWKRMRNTRDYLVAHGKSALNGDGHLPIPMSRDELLRVLRETDWRSPPGLCVGPIYLNWTNAQMRPLSGRKATCGGPLPAAEVRARIAGRWFLGHSDGGFTGELRAVLDELFPEASKWEK